MTALTAEFDGKERQFEIRREHMPFLEMSLGRPAYSVLQDFTKGDWRFDDIAQLLSFGLHGPSAEDRTLFRIIRQGAKFGAPIVAWRHNPRKDVIAVLHRDGHGNYAPLAADILSMAIFGPVAEPADG